MCLTSLSGWQTVWLHDNEVRPKVDGMSVSELGGPEVS